MQNSLSALDEYQTLQRRWSWMVTLVVVVAPFAAGGLFFFFVAVAHLRLSIVMGGLGHGSYEAFFLGVIGSLLLAAEVVLIRKALTVRRQLKEFSLQD